MGTMNETDLEILEYGKEFSREPLSVYRLIEDHRRLRDLNKHLDDLYYRDDIATHKKAEELLKDWGYICITDLHNYTTEQLEKMLDESLA